MDTYGITEEQKAHYLEGIRSMRRVEKASTALLAGLAACRAAMESLPPGELLAAAEGTLNCEHRTHQQIDMRAVIMPLLQAFAKSCEEDHYDTRNFQAVKAAWWMVEALKKDDFSFPCI